MNANTLLRMHLSPEENYSVLNLGRLFELSCKGWLCITSCKGMEVSECFLPRLHCSQFIRTVTEMFSSSKRYPQLLTDNLALFYILTFTSFKYLAQMTTAFALHFVHDVCIFGAVLWLPRVVCVMSGLFFFLPLFFLDLRCKIWYVLLALDTRSPPAVLVAVSLQSLTQNWSVNNRILR